MAKKTKYQIAAEEITDLFGMKPPIDIDADEEDLKEAIKEALESATEDDEFSKTTQEVIDELTEAVEETKPDKKGKATSTAKGKSKEKEPDPEPEDENSDLKEEIENAKTVKELKAIALEHEDLFDDVDLKEKDIDVLGESMLAALEEKEPEKPAKKETKAPAKTAKKEEPVDEDPYADLRDEIAAAETIKELKALAMDHDEFEDVNLKEKDLDVMAEEMNGILDNLAKPAKSEKKPVAKSEKAEKETKPDAKKAETSHRSAGYTRIDAVCESLKKEKPESIEDWIEVANNEYVANGGSDNINETKTMVKYAVKVLGHFKIARPTE